MFIMIFMSLTLLSFFALVFADIYTEEKWIKPVLGIALAVFFSLFIMATCNYSDKTAAAYQQNAEAITTIMEKLYLDNADKDTILAEAKRTLSPTSYRKLLERLLWQEK